MGLGLDWEARSEILGRWPLPFFFLNGDLDKILKNFDCKVCNASVHALCRLTLNLTLQEKKKNCSDKTSFYINFQFPLSCLNSLFPLLSI